MKVLYLQNSPCIRNYKYANALRKKGIEISLAYTEKSLSQRYPGLSDNVYNKLYHINDLKHLWEIIKDFDLIHSHNEPDTLTVGALVSGKPVIHDTHDLISLRDKDNPNTAYFEAIANKGAHGRIYSTPYQMNKAKSFYGIEGSSKVIYNYISLDDKPKLFLPKLSAKDGKIHIVYEGGLGGAEHRKFTNIFIDLAKLGLMIHIYPAGYSEKIAETLKLYPNIFYNKPVSPEILMTEMTQYDYGIIPWNIVETNKEFLDSTIANKLFEYLAAGLPVFTSEVESYRDYFKNNAYGMLFHDAQDLLSKIDRMAYIKQNTDFTKLVFSYEDQADEIIAYYEKVIKDFKSFSKHSEMIQNEKSDLSHNLNSKTKILYLAFVEPKYKQIYTKMEGQIKGLTNAGANVKAYVIGKGESCVNSPLIKVINTELNDLRRDQLVDKIIRSEQADYIYFRYPNGYNKVLEPLLQVLKNQDNVFYEHNTNEEDELRENGQINSLEQEIHFGRELVSRAKGSICVTSVIEKHQRDRINKQNHASIVIGNGISVDDYPLAKSPLLNDEFVMLFTGYIALHHGLERIINGMGEYKGSYKTKLYIIGRSFNREYEERLRQLCALHNLEQNVIFTGELNKEELNLYFDLAHICIGSLGLHRINQEEASSLKSRECLARGKSIVLDHKDSDIDEDKSFIYKVKADESAIDVNNIITFYKELKIEAQEIRTFARTNLDWQAKMQKLLSFFKNANNQKSDTQIIQDSKEYGYSFILILRNDFENNLACLQSIAQHCDSLNYELIIIGIKCQGHNLDLLESLEGDVRLIKLDTECSNEEAYSYGNKLAKCKYIHLDETFRASKEWVERLTSEANKKKFRDLAEFQTYYNQYKNTRIMEEKALSLRNRDQERFYVKGHCAVCNKASEFMVDWQLNYNGSPGYRERLVCNTCELSARKRMVVEYLLEHYQEKEKVLCFESKSMFYKYLSNKLGEKHVCGCEYLGDNYTSGDLIKGILHEDIMNSSFEKASFDYIIANDVFEHVPDFQKAFKEMGRVLKSNGKMIFTIPFHNELKETRLRARVNEKTIEYLEEARYHKDPIRKEGSLVFNDFAWDILQYIKKAGFSDSYVLDYYDKEKGLFGDGSLLLFIAEK